MVNWFWKKKKEEEKPPTFEEFSNFSSEDRNKAMEDEGIEAKPPTYNQFVSMRESERKTQAVEKENRMFEEEIEYIDKRLLELGLFDYKEQQNDMTFILSLNNTYKFRIRYINTNNLKCELTKSEVLGGMIFAGKVMSSCVISDWQNKGGRMKEINDWIENFLLIPEIRLLMRSKKINKFIDKC